MICTEIDSIGKVPDRQLLPKANVSRCQAAGELASVGSRVVHCTSDDFCLLQRILLMKLASTLDMRQ